MLVLLVPLGFWLGETLERVIDRTNRWAA